jgi:hypothetical protein
VQRGFKKVQDEWALVCATHNILNVLSHLLVTRRRRQIGGSTSSE